jgi:RHS repeat-associated protein
LNNSIAINRLSEKYCYAHPGARLQKSSQHATKTTIRSQKVRYLPGLEIHTTHNGSTLTHQRQCITLNGLRVLHWQQGKPADSGNHQVCYSVCERNGSRTLELDGRGRIISRESYYPFGGTALWATHQQTAADVKTRRYCAKERDVSGLYYYGFRYYAPWLMRWLNTDPASTADGLNLFAMVRNNPVTLQDREGCIATSLEAISGLKQTANMLFTANIQPDQTFAEQEIAHFPLLVEAANHRYPDLKLTYFSNHKDFIRQLGEDISYGQSRYIFPPYGAHRVLVDALRTEDNKISLVAFDSLGSILRAKSDTEKFTTELNKTHPGTPFVSFATGIQSSPSGCSFFSLVLGIHASKEKESVLQIHNALRTSGKYKGFSGQEYIADRVKSTLFDSAPLDILPEVFFKHTQRKSQMKWLVEVRPELAEKPVNKKQQTILARQYSLLREDLQTNKNYSYSIELKRISLLTYAESYFRRRAS